MVPQPNCPRPCQCVCICIVCTWQGPFLLLGFFVTIPAHSMLLSMSFCPQYFLLLHFRWEIMGMVTSRRTIRSSPEPEKDMYCCTVNGKMGTIRNVLDKEYIVAHIVSSPNPKTGITPSSQINKPYSSGVFLQRNTSTCDWTRTITTYTTCIRLF